MTVVHTHFYIVADTQRGCHTLKYLAFYVTLMFATVLTTARQYIVSWATLRPAGNHRNHSSSTAYGLQAHLHVTDALSKLSLCTRPPGSDVRTTATETARTSGRDIRHTDVWHCEDEALQNVSNYCRRLTNTGLTLTVVAREELPTDVNMGAWCIPFKIHWA